MKNPLLTIGGALIALQAAGALLAPLVAPYGPIDQDILSRLKAPGWPHLLGTDNFGRDTMSRILFGYRTLFAISLAAVLGALAIGGTLVILAAYRGGWIDRIAMRGMDILFAFPIVLLAMGIVAILGPGAISTGIAIGIVYVPIFARTLVLREPTTSPPPAPAVRPARPSCFAICYPTCPASSWCRPACRCPPRSGGGQPLLPRPRHPAAAALARAHAVREPRFPNT